MAKRQTAEIASADLLGGDSLYLERARKTLPYLVRQAKAGTTIYYSSLAKEVGIPNPRNLNFVLGAIGNALILLRKQAKLENEIPPIQGLVVNMRDGLPGEGIGKFLGPTDFGKLTKTQKRKLVSAQLLNISTYQYWDWVLEQLGLKSLPINVDKLLTEAKKEQTSSESDKHKDLKLYVAKNPAVVGLRSTLLNGQIEYALPSADRIDVVFTDKGLKIGIEVKSSISSKDDILRGLFQCVKYRHLIEAEQMVKNEVPNSQVILVLEGDLPYELESVKNVLGIEVIENVIPTKI